MNKKGEKLMSGEKFEQAVIPAGFGVSGGLTTLPLWIQHVSAWAQAISPIIGVLVGLATLYVLVRKILRGKDKE